MKTSYQYLFKHPLLNFKCNILLVSECEANMPTWHITTVRENQQLQPPFTPLSKHHQVHTPTSQIVPPLLLSKSNTRGLLLHLHNIWFKSRSSGLWPCVMLQEDTDILEYIAASILRVKITSPWRKCHNPEDNMHLHHHGNLNSLHKIWCSHHD